MTERKLHIISFDYPFPPIYGGVIDVYYKIKALAELGVEIHLHSFSKDNKPTATSPDDNLKQYCKAIHHYPRATHWRKAISTEPYIIRSRQSDKLVQRLKADAAPILLEGMHSMAVLDHGVHHTSRVLLRMHNVEWDYYRGLADATDTFWKKAYFRIEAYRLKLQHAPLKKVNRILAISQNDQLKLKPFNSHVDWLPPFHGHKEIDQPAPHGNYALYHGNLAVAENRKAAEYLLEVVFESLDLELVIAGKAPPQDWLNRYGGKAKFELDVSGDRMEQLISEAGCHVLPTFQATGVKLKLIHALYSGRPCIVNEAMVAGTGLADTCVVCDDVQSMQQAIKTALSGETKESDRHRRAEILNRDYNDRTNAQKLIKWLFED